jgi:omega-6 fatty acid desaturase / acyl-lipid omega-6 desaturase (Delta-12 desaturase)
MRPARGAILAAATVRGLLIWYKRHDTPTPDFNPNAVMFAPHQFGQIILSDVGILLWLGALTAWIYQSGFSQVFRLYLVPYLW